MPYLVHRLQTMKAAHYRRAPKSLPYSPHFGRQVKAKGEVRQDMNEPYLVGSVPQL
jgi:hypothetical protein